MSVCRIEFIPWYRAGVALVLCGGDDGCGALIGDADLHRKWHVRSDQFENFTLRQERKPTGHNDSLTGST
jgi:hypothetical protein